MIAHSPADRGFIEGRRCLKALTADVGSWVLFATILGSSMVFIDGTVVNVVLPVIGPDLHASSIDLQWIIVAYTLFLSSLMLVGGSLGDHFGRRRAFVIGVIIFAGASAWCGMARTAEQLIVARAVAGVGSALLTPGSLSLISASFTKAERGRAIGVWSSFTAVTAAAGPALGGWLAEHASWRWVFFINLPLAVVVLLVALFRVPESHDDERVHHIDWTGAALCAAGLGGIVYALTFSSELGWRSAPVVAGLAGGAAALALFIAVEARSRSPLMPLGLFASRTFSGVNALTLLLYGAMSGVTFFLPFDLIQVQRYTPTEAGLAMLPLIALVFALSRSAGGLASRYGMRTPLVVGPIVAACGCALFAVPGVGGSYWTTFFPAIVTLGLGMAISVAPLTTAVMSSVSEDRIGVASGFNNAIARVGAMLAIAGFGLVTLTAYTHGLESRLERGPVPAAVAAAVMSDRFALAATAPPSGVDAATRDEIHRDVLDAYVGAFRVAMLAAAALAVVGALIAAATIERSPQ